MSNIEYIKNVTIATTFGYIDEEKQEYHLDVEEFSHQLTTLPDPYPDEMIVRCVTFKGFDEDENIYLLRANFVNNEIIASFPGHSAVTVCPQSVIRLNTPLPNILEFKIHKPQRQAPSKLVTDLSGDFSLHLEFIKYKRT